MDAQADLGERAFGVMSAAERERWGRSAADRISQGAFLGAFADGRPAGAALYFDMRQWWHGRALPMAGVASVKIAPEYRGRGIGRRLMTHLLDLIAERGYPLSALYPATMPIYRSLGWELAGGRYQTSVPSRELRSLLEPDAALAGAGADWEEDGVAPAAPALAKAADAVEIRRATPDDAATVIEVIGKAHEASRHSGPLTRDTEAVARWLAGDGLYAYLAGDGFTAYRWSSENDELFVRPLVAASPRTYRALWSVVASHSSTARTVRGLFAPDDPLWWLTRERDVVLDKRSMWMLRVVDAPAAIAARGFPPGVELGVSLLIADNARPSNAGRWRLEIADGKGALVPDGNGNGAGDALTLGARGLAALYAGTPVATLRHVGLASGGTAPRDDAALDAAFSGTAFMLDSF
jgi:predicted acetyltransferase